MPLPLRGGHNAGHLVGQVNAGLLREAEGGGVFRNRVDAEFLRQRVKEGVAGERNGLLNTEYTVMLVALEEATVEGSAAYAVDSHVLRDAFLQAGGGHDDLEGGTGGKLILNGLVHQRMARVGDELVPVIALDLDGKGVGVKAGVRDQRQNLSVARIHHHHRAVGCSQGQLGGALNVEIDGELEILAGGGMLGTQIAHFAAMRIDNDVS